MQDKPNDLPDRQPNGEALKPITEVVLDRRATIHFTDEEVPEEDILRQLPQARLPSGWKELPAVKTNQVWAVDATSYFSRPGPRVVHGVEILARILHPEIIGPAQCQD